MVKGLFHTTRALPFHGWHDDDLLTPDEVEQILMTLGKTVRWWRQIGIRPEFFRIGRRLYTLPSVICADGSMSSGSLLDPPSTLKVS